MDDTTRAAFECLLDLARIDTGQPRRAANVILPWWNADNLGGFNIVEQDTAIAADMAIVFGWTARRSNAALTGGVSLRDRGPYRGVATGGLGPLEGTRRG